MNEEIIILIFGVLLVVIGAILFNLHTPPCNSYKVVTAIDYQLGGLFHDKAEYFIRFSDGSVKNESDYIESPYKIGDKECAN